MGDLRRVAIVGGGMTGLAAALQLREQSPPTEVVLLEAAPQLGGVLGTERRDGFLIERSADMFATKTPWLLDLCRRIGYDQQLIGIQEQCRRAFVVCRGSLTPVPDGFALLRPVRIWPVVKSPLLSWRGKARLFWERFVPRRRDRSDESLASFARRRLGREAYERLVQPLIGGIYSADPERLSMAATLPQFLEMEHLYGSLTRAVRRQGRDEAEQQAGGARYGQFLTPREGFRHLVDTMAGQLPEGSVRLGAKATAVRQAADGWQVELADQPSLTGLDAVIVATPAGPAARLLRDQDAALAGLLDEIPYAGASVVVVGCRRSQIAHPLDGSGAVAPMIERRQVLAVSFSSSKFAGRAPQDQVLLRVFVGGACQSELNSLPDESLRQLVRRELQELVGLQGEPLFEEIVRWDGAMPQYHVGHLQHVERIERQTAEHAGLALAGSAYRGVGLPFCVRSGQRAAERIMETAAAT